VYPSPKEAVADLCNESATDEERANAGSTDGVVCLVLGFPFPLYYFFPRLGGIQDLVHQKQAIKLDTNVWCKYRVLTYEDNIGLCYKNHFCPVHSLINEVERFEGSLPKGNMQSYDDYYRLRHHSDKSTWHNVLPVDKLPGDGHARSAKRNTASKKSEKAGPKKKKKKTKSPTVETRGDANPGGDEVIVVLSSSPEPGPEPSSEVEPNNPCNNHMVRALWYNVEGRRRLAVEQNNIYHFKTAQRLHQIMEKICASSVEFNSAAKVRRHISGVGDKTYTDFEYYFSNDEFPDQEITFGSP